MQNRMVEHPMVVTTRVPSPHRLQGMSLSVMLEEGSSLRRAMAVRCPMFMSPANCLVKSKHDVQTFSKLLALICIGSWRVQHTLQRKMNVRSLLPTPPF